MTQTERFNGGTVPRYLAILVAAVLGLALFPAAALAGHNPDDIDPCRGAPTANEYVDYDEARDVHKPSIDCVIYRSIAVGTSNDAGEPVYNPLNPVTRGQMASFIAQTLDAGGYEDELSEGNTDRFTDIQNSVHKRNINRLADANIVRGVSANRYAPGELVTRQQMASFIVQAARFAVGDQHPIEADGVDRFIDVAEDNVHEDNIEAGADTEPPLFRGVSATQFDPGKNVLRDQMATFLVNLLRFIFDPDRAPGPQVRLLIDDRTVAAGEPITGVLENAKSATVEGDCLVEGGAVADTDENEDGIQFSLETSPDAEAGECVLTFTVIDNNDEEVTRTARITIEGRETPPNNQDFAVTPQEDALNPISSSTQTNEGAHQVSANVGDATAVDVALVPCEDVTVDADGNVTFGDAEGQGNPAPGNNQADNLGNTDAVIEVVNGVSGNYGDYVNNVSPDANGNVRVTIDSTVAECVRTLFFVDANNNNALDLDANNQPVEAEFFGISGQKRWEPAEAQAGDIGAEDEVVQRVDKANNTIVTNDATYIYREGDTFFVVNGEAGTNVTSPGCGQQAQQVTLAQFEAQLSTGDQLDESTFYRPGTELPSTFCLEDLDPAAPTGVTATAVSSNTIRVSFNAVPGADSYNIYRATDTDQTNNAANCPTDPAQYTQVGTVPAGQTQFEDTGLTADTEYCYQVTAVNDGDESARSNTAQAQTNAAAGETQRPIITDARLTADTGVQGELNQGDVFTIVFNESMHTSTATDGLFVVLDPDGDRIQINCGTAGADDTQATCAFTDADRTTLRIELQQVKLTGNTGGDGVPEYPIRISTTDADVKDNAGNVVSIGNSTDVVIGEGGTQGD